MMLTAGKVSAQFRETSPSSFRLIEGGASAPKGNDFEILSRSASFNQGPISLRDNET